MATVSKRSRARRAAVQALYQWELTSQGADQIEAGMPDDSDLKALDVAYFRKLIAGVPKHLAEFDPLLEPGLGRSMKDVDPVERAVLRVACFELLYLKDVPWRVVIDEAVTTARMFGSDNGYKFVNSSLDQVAESIHDGSAQVALAAAAVAAAQVKETAISETADASGTDVEFPGAPSPWGRPNGDSTREGSVESSVEETSNAADSRSVPQAPAPAESEIASEGPPEAVADVEVPDADVPSPWGKSAESSTRKGDAESAIEKTTNPADSKSVEQEASAAASKVASKAAVVSEADVEAPDVQSPWGKSDESSARDNNAQSVVEDTRPASEEDTVAVNTASGAGSTSDEDDAGDEAPGASSPWGKSTASRSRNDDAEAESADKSDDDSAPDAAPSPWKR